jgi:putative transposase
MKIEKVSYSSSLGIQVAAINFATKYRHKVFGNAKLKMKVMQSFKETEIAHSKRTGMKLLEVGIDIDHVHLVVQWGPGIPLSRIMQLIKGRSAKDVFNSFPKLKEEKFWGGHFWSPSYHFLTTGPSDLKHHLDYVKSQGKPRWPIPGQNQMKLDAYVV